MLSSAGLRGRPVAAGLDSNRNRSAEPGSIGPELCRARLAGCKNKVIVINLIGRTRALDACCGLKRELTVCFSWPATRIERHTEPSKLKPKLELNENENGNENNKCQSWRSGEPTRRRQ